MMGGKKFKRREEKGEKEKDPAIRTHYQTMIKN